MNLSLAKLQLFRGAQVYAPASLGIKDILVGWGKILSIETHIDISPLESCQVIDLNGKALCPGLIDQHVHFIGGGGEAGPTTRTPEVRLSALVEGGITTAVGLLGTDAVTRHPESLLAKTRALNEEGITAYMLTGAYSLPSPTITDSVMKDIALIDPIIGVKCAISDHRSSAPNGDALAQMAAQSRVGGLLGKKVGISVFHMGNSAKQLTPIYQILESSDVPINKLLPTHINRNEALFDAAIAYALKGGYIDVTSGIPEPISPAQAIAKAVNAGVPLSHLTVSSDGNGSQPVFDALGNLKGIGVAGFESLLETVVNLVKEHGFTLSDALTPLTQSVADFLGLDEKGGIAEGKDADFIILDQQLKLESLYAKGIQMVRQGKACVKGTFES